jgi:hypothetical protein
MEPEVSSPHSQEPATCRYSLPSVSNPCLPNPPSCKSILIVSYHLRLGLASSLFSLIFHHQTPVRTSPLPRTCYVPSRSHFHLFDHSNNICWRILLSGEEGTKVLLLRPRCIGPGRSRTLILFCSILSENTWSAKDVISCVFVGVSELTSWVLLLPLGALFLLRKRKLFIHKKCM